MKSTIKGKVFILGDDIDTDQIIPANYLSYNPSIPEERKYFGKFALSGVPSDQSGLPEGNVPFIKEGFSSEYKIIIGGKNFGCGSSREHAPLAIREAGVEVVIANFYARIFYRNSINGGYLVPIETDHDLKSEFKTGDLAEIDLEKNTITRQSDNKIFQLNSLGDVIGIIEAGDIFEYAKKENI
ncbi:MAG: 3-isopropylmalate dehydratase [Candidatus Margulisiibacteriota bacterium]|nr:MAG: 3-isopropylmalate dehydratase [Candidatus Margulisbacteria bacterium GWD2_39_127]OGI04295.1 MAG: 3-isopropylmalate dehydratase [Candidatus Margulisbacteria bacterium GWF2_38_17]OGI11800.1 MAG: 3-isopropylmalate dehydratase [Candidatus Margulisbacteria bacterium GWE2_39_32]PZM79829.1 MAG: 3-isopropylmalate dehydratase [Candidatus Margulisiibacteriota bacterium]HAR62738.1 3-isopropylmalate dehydratase [Candidatus Margulisiibacteriota bacterium]